MTTAEYLQRPEAVYPQELAYGVLHVADSPVASHQRVVVELTLALVPYVRERRLGEILIAPMDVVLDRENALVVQPDLLFVADSRRGIVTDRVYGAPDLVIEVLSPHPRIGRLDQHLGWFAQYGVRECWLADLTGRHISVLALNSDGVTRQRVVTGAQSVRSDVLGDLGVSPMQVFGY